MTHVIHPAATVQTERIRLLVILLSFATPSLLITSHPHRWVILKKCFNQLIEGIIYYSYASPSTKVRKCMNKLQSTDTINRGDNRCLHILKTSNSTKRLQAVQRETWSRYVTEKVWACRGGPTDTHKCCNLFDVIGGAFYFKHNLLYKQGTRSWWG